MFDPRYELQAKLNQPLNIFLTQLALPLKRTAEQNHATHFVERPSQFQEIRGETGCRRCEYCYSGILGQHHSNCPLSHTRSCTIHSRAFDHIHPTSADAVAAVRRRPPREIQSHPEAAGHRRAREGVIPGQLVRSQTASQPRSPDYTEYGCEAPPQPVTSRTVFRERHLIGRLPRYQH